MIKFDIIQLSLFIKSIANKRCLTGAANRKTISTRDINAKTLEVNIICQVINKQFNVKAKLWQISIIINIIKQNQDIYEIVSINTNKSLVYHLILVIINDIIHIILPTIILIEN